MDFSQRKLNFLQYCKKIKNLGDKTIHCYEESIDILGDFMSRNDLDFSNFNSKNSTEFLHGLMDSSLENRSINRHISALRQFFLFLIKEKVIVKNPFVDIRPRKNVKKLPVFLTEDEMHKLIRYRALEYSYDALLERAILCTFLFTGIRRSELLSMKLADIDFSKNEILIHGKGKKDRIVYFTDYCKGVLKAYLEKRKSKSDMFFVSEDCQKYSSALITKLFYKIDSLSFTNKHITPHVLRHSFASYMVSNNSDIFYIQHLLGHSSIVSSNVYMHTSFDDIFKNYDKVFSKKAIQ